MVEGRPLVVCGPDGVPVDAAFQNDKGARKTVEQGELWALHPNTGRLLPYADGIPASVTDHGSWYRATLSRLPDGEPFAGHHNKSGPVREQSAETAVQSQGEPPAESGIGPTLDSLAALIRLRRVEMPEGSYTTHLFDGGSAKIRKKTGEEAVELILSSDTAELTREAADLVYHLLVLLELEGVDLSALSDELRRR